MKTGRERIEEQRQRKAEYEKMRAVMLAIVDDDKASNSDRIAAVKVIYQIDKNIPMPENN